MKEFQLEVRPPFHLQASVRVLQRRERNPVDRWVNDGWLGVVRVGGASFVVHLRNVGTREKPDLRLRATSDAVIPSVRARLGLDVDPSPLDAALEVLPGAERLRSHLQGLRPPRYGTVFESMVSVVPFQQVSLDAGATLFERLVRRYGERHDYEEQSCFAPPTPEALVDAEPDALRELGLSRTKSRALVEGAKQMLAGAIDENSLGKAALPDAVRTLETLHGIGPWSAHLILLRGFGRLDSFPPGDAGVARSLSTLTAQTVTAADSVALGARLQGQAGWLYYLSLAAGLVERGLIGEA